MYALYLKNKTENLCFWEQGIVAPHARINMEFIYLLLCVCTMFINSALSSAGDRSWIFNKCMKGCVAVNCTTTVALKSFAVSQPYSHQLLLWDCTDECDYQCMWTTVDAYQRDGTPVPQFHGKWPFIELFGMQEPASVLFSILNGLANIYCLIKVWQSGLSKAPMYYLWQFNAVVAINAWTWSSIFHSRDFPFTEMMDYFCAIMINLVNSFMLCVRLTGSDNSSRVVLIALCLIAFFVYHVHYLAFVRFDYGYNMKAMVTVGLAGSVGWISWGLSVFKRQPYVWKCVSTIVSINLLLLLELGDFPPYWWIFDAHSLWHAGTVPLAVLWGSFVIDDMTFLLKEETPDKYSKLPQRVNSNDKKKTS